MQINQFKEVISACRFCFMCRHLSSVGLISCRESDTPRGRALIADRIRMFPDELNNSDFIETIYRSDLSGANRFHCDGYHDGNGFDEIGLQLALRRDIAEAGLAPESVTSIVDELKSSNNWNVEEADEVLYLIDYDTAQRPKIQEAVTQVLNHAGIKFGTIHGGNIGKILAVLGFVSDAEVAMRKFATVINATGAKALLVSSPAAIDALQNDFKTAGIELKPKVRFTADYFTELTKEHKLKLVSKNFIANYLASDYLKNYLKCDWAEKLLALLKIKNRQFSTNPEESFTAGEGALVLDKLYPELTKQLAERIITQTEQDVPLITASAYTANLLGAMGVNITTLDEVVAEALC